MAAVAKYLRTEPNYQLYSTSNYKDMESMLDPCQQSPREVCALQPSAVAVQQLEPATIASPLSLEEAIRLLTAAADHGYQFLFATAERNFSRIARASVARTLTHSGGAWRPWDHLETPDGLDGALGDLPTESSSWTATTRVGSKLFVPVRSGSVAILIDDARLNDAMLSEIGSMAAALDLALTACEWRHATTDNLDGLRALQRVATRILKSHDLEEILLLVTHEAKRLLSADICGIMLREDNAVVMRRCVGNFSIATASLRMRPGQGVAGRVFATRESCRVEDYLKSNIISQDFFELARTEMVRSALAAPLLSQSEVIGVLEVWRRRPSTFTERDSGRLEALANLTSLAIENARLSQAREAVLRELAETNDALKERYEAIRSSTAFQEDLIRLLLERKNLTAIAVQASTQISGPIFIFDSDLHLEAAFPPVIELPSRLRLRIEAAVRRHGGGSAALTASTVPDGMLSLQPVTAGAERFGWVVVITANEPDETSKLTLSQVCIATALHQMERRAAARARAETLETVLWDLLEGSEDVRQLALSRAREQHVDLTGRHCVFLCSIDRIEKLAMTEGWSAKDVEQRRSVVRDAAERIEGLRRSIKLLGMRGNLLGMICGDDAAKNAAQLGRQLATKIANQIPKLSVHVGASGPCQDPIMFPTACREARISLEVARLRGQVDATVYSDVGIVGLLMSLREETDFKRLVRSILGPLLSQDTLLLTLSTFFKFDCSRQSTAKDLGIHHKTVCYRLAKVTEMTGLDLNRHEDRLLADLALRIHNIMGFETK